MLQSTHKLCLFFLFCLVFLKKRCFAYLGLLLILCFSTRGSFKSVWSISRNPLGDQRCRPTTSLLPPIITCKRRSLLRWDSEWLWVIWVRNICCILCCGVWLWGSLGGTASAVVLVLLLLVILNYLWQPETLAKEVDERLAEVLLRPVTVQEVSLIRIYL